jgi:thermostable 8-oxoguanine DNA glycosylase
VTSPFSPTGTIVNGLSPAGVMERLASIENDLGERQDEFDQAAGDSARLVREWEYRLAVAQTKATTGTDANARKAAAFVAAASQEDGLFERLKEAEGQFAAARAAVKVLETRAMIGMGILKGLGRG